MVINMKKITFDGGCCRDGEIIVEVTECHGCGNRLPCIVIDASEHEYKSGAICKDCIDKMLQEFEHN